MALTNKLTAIADGFRSSRKTTNKYSLDEMAVLAAEKIKEEMLLTPSSVPAYVTPEIIELVNKVKAVQTEDSVTFIALSDSHYPAEQVLNWYDSETTKSTIQANTATKILAYLLNLDFIAHTGDVSAGSGSTTIDDLKSQIEGFNSYFAEACGDIPFFIAIGNHDAGIYYHDAQIDAGNTGIYTLDGSYLYNNFTKYSDSSNTVISGEEYGGYCYRDFTDKKMRVFLLNTSEYIAYNQTDNATLGSQRVWLANALLNLNNKSDAAEWSFVILCHYPADYGATMPLSQVLKAYVEGGSISITTENNTTSAINFSNKNKAKFMAQFHGHIHNFKYDNLAVSLYPDYTPVPYDAYRICIPNGEYAPARHNYYGTYAGINFKEESTYTKTVDTVNGTSFVVNVIIPSENIVHSFCYGAGYDRTISTDVRYFSIVTNLTGATIQHSATSVKEGESYTGTVTVQSGYELDSIVIKMGGIDITSTAYNSSTSVISIAEVTGTINITVVAKALPVNLLPLSLATDGSLYNGGKGYKSGYRISTSSGTESEKSGMFISGFIPIDLNTQTITLHNIGTAIVSYTQSLMIGFNELKNGTQNGNLDLATKTPNADGSITITASDFPNNDLSKIRYFRLSCSYIGSDSEVYVK